MAIEDGYDSKYAMIGKKALFALSASNIPLQINGFGVFWSKPASDMSQYQQCDVHVMEWFNRNTAATSSEDPFLLSFKVYVSKFTLFAENPDLGDVSLELTFLGDDPPLSLVEGVKEDPVLLQGRFDLDIGITIEKPPGGDKSLEYLVSAKPITLVNNNHITYYPFKGDLFHLSGPIDLMSVNEKGDRKDVVGQIQPFSVTMTHKTSLY